MFNAMHTRLSIMLTAIAAALFVCTSYSYLAKSAMSAKASFQSAAEDELPDGLLRVDYLESDGSQYIDTGIRVDDDFYEITICMQVMQWSNKSWVRLFGSYAGESYRSTHLIRRDRYNDQLYGTYDRKSNNQMFLNVDPRIKRTYVLSARKLYVITDGDAEFIDMSKAYPWGNIPSPIPSIFIFPDSDGTVMRCWSFTVKHNGIAVQDLVPVCFLNEDEAIEGAMYDKISHQLFRNNGSGIFSIGLDKTN